MKITLLALVFTGLSSSVFATVTTEQLSGLKIKSAPVKQAGQKVVINGEQFTKQLTKQAQTISLKRSARSLAATVVKGDIVTAENGFNEYQVTGEIVVELNTNSDVQALAKQHNLLIKQAYKDYYVLVDEHGRDLNQLVTTLAGLQQIKSANIDLRDTSLGIQ
ncbi:hypothetical protein NQT69_11240 [Pseudoalteromonas shioyasakiensis]|uniref:hypothetical protein n=1 Tax=Pseudoalteromonas shioyasakiensis TaxID=1190813 RepID=UPI002118F385|nr:hypothetical protein [Pseudoalteromonas shioyasakiensis]MCQ8878577.1 hypothetical protein [Pseudoalteromonas shioyasakiensis]